MKYGSLIIDIRIVDGFREYETRKNMKEMADAIRDAGRHHLYCKSQ